MNQMIQLKNTARLALYALLVVAILGPWESGQKTQNLKFSVHRVIPYPGKLSIIYNI